MLYDETVRKTVRVLTTIVIFGLSLALIYKLHTVLTWLAIGTFLAIVINPAVSLFTRYMPKKKRGLSVTAVMLIGIVFMAGLLFVTIPPIVDQTTQLVDDWPQITQDIQSNIETSNSAPYKFIREHDLDGYFQSHTDEVKNWISSFIKGSLDNLAGFIDSLGAIFTIVAVLIYMSVNGPRYAEFYKKRLPKRHKKDVEELFRKMYKAITGYVNGNLLTSLMAGLSCAAMTTILGLPYVALLSLLVAILDLIPLVGATIAAVIVVTVALFSSTTDAIIMTVFFIIYQQFENYVLAPHIVGRTVKLPSFIVFIAALLGAVIAGLVGAIVAIPIASCIKILLEYFLKNWRPTLWSGV